MNIASRLFTTLVLVSALTATAVHADPYGPVEVSLPPTDQGDIHRSETPHRTIAILAPDYTETEYFMSGAATVYTYNDPPVRGEIIPLDEDVPYKTRIIVRTPTDPADFTGTLVIEWLNSTAGFDIASVWDASAEHFTRSGWAYVGVTNATNIITFLTSGCPLLGISIFDDQCGTRYTGLEMSENGQAFEMVSQIANLLKSNAHMNPLYPDYPVERIFHTGQSQQGGSMVTYASAFHFPVNDGYFIQAAGSARRINYGPACGQSGSPAYPDCTPALEGEQRLVRTDLLVPVYRALTETDVSFMLQSSNSFVATRQSDTDNFRYYEMAGTTHVTVHKDIVVIPTDTGFVSEDLYLDDTCAEPINSLVDGPVFGRYLYNAMWENMDKQARYGDTPPQAEIITSDENGIVRDAHENALGGIRLPQMDVPLHSYYSPHNGLDPDVPALFSSLGDLFCVLAGSYSELDAETLRALYEDKGDFSSQLRQSADDLAAAGFLLAADAALLPVPQSKGQQKCINSLIKASAGVGGARGKLIGGCVKAVSKGKANDVDDCISTDAKGRMNKATAKADKLISKGCGETPDFAVSDKDTIVAAASDAQQGLLLDVFGQDGGGVDGMIIRASADKAGASCQGGVTKGYQKLAKTRNKVFSKCAKGGLKAGDKDAGRLNEAIGNAMDLGECLDNDPGLKVAKALAKLDKSFRKGCFATGGAASFGGLCQDVSLPAFADCVAGLIDSRIDATYAWTSD